MIKRIKNLFVDPCKEGYACPVRMCCEMRKFYFWEKRQSCDIYHKYERRKKILDKAIEYPQFVLGFICFCLFPLAWLFTALIWGSWDILKFLYKFIVL